MGLFSALKHEDNSEHLRLFFTCLVLQLWSFKRQQSNCFMLKLGCLNCDTIISFGSCIRINILVIFENYVM